MRIEQKQKLVQDLISFFEDQVEGVNENFLMSNLAYAELKINFMDQEVNPPCETDLAILQTAFEKLSDSSEKFEEVLSLLQFELEADFDHVQLFHGLKGFVGDDELRLAQLEILFKVGTIH